MFLYPCTVNQVLCEGQSRHSALDKALACHTGGWGWNLDKTKEDFFCIEKIQLCAPISPRVSHHVLSLSLMMAHSYENSGLTCYVGDKRERVTWKNPSTAICGGEI